jgi:hypothetical protein
MHVQTPWVNKLLFPPAIKNKLMEPLMTDRLAVLIKHVAKLRQAGLEVCHCVKEFYLQWIHPSIAGDTGIRMSTDGRSQP